MFALILLIVLTTAGCDMGSHAAGVYAPDTRAIVRVDYDYNGDGRIDVRTYMRNGIPARLEGDTNGDGVVDRWEYYDGSGALLRIGGSTQGDGREDTWVRTVGEERHVVDDLIRLEVRRILPRVRAFVDVLGEYLREIRL